MDAYYAVLVSFGMWWSGHQWTNVVRHIKYWLSEDEARQEIMSNPLNKGMEISFYTTNMKLMHSWKMAGNRNKIWT